MFLLSELQNSTASISIRAGVRALLLGIETGPEGWSEFWQVYVGRGLFLGRGLPEQL